MPVNHDLRDRSDDNDIREYVTISRGTRIDGTTHRFRYQPADMAYTRVGHDFHPRRQHLA